MNLLKQSPVLSIADQPIWPDPRCHDPFRMDRFLNLRTPIQYLPHVIKITWQIEFAPILTFSAVVEKNISKPDFNFAFYSSTPWSRECSLCLCLTQLVRDSPEATPCFVFSAPQRTWLDKWAMSGVKNHQSQNILILALPTQSVNRYELECVESVDDSVDVTALSSRTSLALRTSYI